MPRQRIPTTPTARPLRLPDVALLLAVRLTESSGCETWRTRLSSCAAKSSASVVIGKHFGKDFRSLRDFGSLRSSKGEAEMNHRFRAAAVHGLPVPSQDKSEWIQGTIQLVDYQRRQLRVIAAARDR